MYFRGVVINISPRGSVVTAHKYYVIVKNTKVFHRGTKNYIENNSVNKFL